MLLAMDLQLLLENQTCEILGPVPNVKGALEILSEQQPDAATLDFNLNGELSTPVAEMLRERAIPFVVISGYGDLIGDHPVLQGAPLVGKPYDTRELLRKLASVLAEANLD
jgi:DNA-binding response OmpR family regulator